MGERTKLQREAVKIYHHIVIADGMLVNMVPHTGPAEMPNLNDAAALLIAAMQQVEALMHIDDRPFELADVTLPAGSGG